MDNSFIEEIEDEIKKDRIFAIWNKYQKIIIIGFVAIIVGIIAYLQWRGIQRDRAESTAKQVVQIFFDYSSGLNVDARVAELTESSNQDFADLMNVFAAATKMRSQVQDDVQAGYKKMTELAKTCKDQLAKDLAILTVAIYDLDHTTDYKSLMQRLELLTFTRRPFRLVAMEILGVVAHKSGDRARALSCFNEIIDDPDATENMRSRAILLKSVI